MNMTSAEEPQFDELFDYRALIAAFRHYWIALLVATVIAGGAGYALSYQFPSIYRTEAVLTIVSQEQGGGGLRSLAGQYGALASLVGIDVGGAGGDHDRAANIALLHSRLFVGKFIEAEKLLPEIFPDRWDSNSRTWKPGKEAPTLLDGTEAFLKKNLFVNEDRKTGIVTLRLEGRNREKLAEWANLFISRANDLTREIAIKDASDSISYLNKELPRMDTVELRQSLYSLLASQMNKRMLASTRPEFAYRVIDPAQTPSIRARVSPSRIGFAAAGAFLALLVGGIVAFIAHRRGVAGRS